MRCLWPALCRLRRVGGALEQGDQLPVAASVVLVWRGAGAALPGRVTRVQWLGMWLAPAESSREIAASPWTTRSPLAHSRSVIRTIGVRFGQFSNPVQYQVQS